MAYYIFISDQRRDLKITKGPKSDHFFVVLTFDLYFLPRSFSINIEWLSEKSLTQLCVTLNMSNDPQDFSVQNKQKNDEGFLNGIIAIAFVRLS